MIKIGDDIMAVAFMANAQHPRIAKILRLARSNSYEEMLAVAENPCGRYSAEPVGGAYKAG